MNRPIYIAELINAIRQEDPRNPGGNRVTPDQLRRTVRRLGTRYLGLRKGGDNNIEISGAEYDRLYKLVKTHYEL